MHTVRETAPPRADVSEDADSRPHAPVPWLWLAAITVLAAVLRAIGLNGGLWLDEMYAVMDNIRPSLGQIVTAYPSDTHHPLYSMLAHIAVAFAGESPWVVRLPALLFGVAAVPALYILSRHIGSRAEALAAALLLAVSYHHVWFSQNARGYTALAFFAILCGYALLRGIDERRPRWFVLYAVFVALGAYTHLTLVFMAFSHALLCAWLAFGPVRGRERLDWRLPLIAFGGGALLTVGLYLPMLDDVLWWFLYRPSNLLGVSTPSWALSEGVRVLALGLGVHPLLLLAGGGVFLTGVVSLWRQSPVIVGVFLLPAFGTLAGALLARGTMYPRFFFYLAGFLLLVAVRGTLVTGTWFARRLLPAALRRHGAAAAYILIAVLVLGSMRSLMWNYSHPKQDFAGAMAYTEAERGADEAIMVAGVHYPYTTFHQRPWEPIESVERFHELRSAGRPFLLVYMQPLYIERGAPGLVDAIREACEQPRTFTGTVGGGDIHVCRVQPTPADG